jgi:DNA polymerase-3 subunit delta'
VARLLDQVFGHQEVIAQLLTTLSGPRPGQTFLFVGLSGIGKKKVALGLAQGLLCEHTVKACGSCASCLRLAAGAHESLKVIEATGPQIKIDESREVLSFLNLQGLTKRRVVIIDQAQTLNLQAANALLKILEEPPAETYFFLIAPSSAGLLPTIRSRSRTVQFRPLSLVEMKRALPNAPEWALRASQGSFEKLGQLQEGPEQELRGEALQLLQDFVQDADFLVEGPWREAFKERARAQKILGYWVSFLRDVLYFKQDPKSAIMNIDQVDLLNTLARKGVPELLHLVTATMQAEVGVLQNRDVALLMEEFWIQRKEFTYAVGNAIATT